VDGLDVDRDADLVRPRIAYLSHATGLYDDLTARENLDFAALMLDTPDRPARVARALDDMGLASRADDRVRTFSAGMRKRLALGRMLLSRASLVLLDEPMAALDDDGMGLVVQLLHAWKDVGVTVLVAAHTADRLEPLLDARIVLDRGLVVDVTGAGVVNGPVTVPTETRPAVAAR
jgi:ABC-type multidrug transport system ATPase subunit